MMNLSKQIIPNTNDESINMPSQTTLMHNEIVHFYVDLKSLEELNAEDEDVVKEVSNVA